MAWFGPRHRRRRRGPRRRRRRHHRPSVAGVATAAGAPLPNNKYGSELNSSGGVWILLLWISGQARLGALRQNTHRQYAHTDLLSSDIFASSSVPGCLCRMPIFQQLQVFRQQRVSRHHFFKQRHLSFPASTHGRGFLRQRDTKHIMQAGTVSNVQAVAAWSNQGLCNCRDVEVYFGQKRVLQ